MTPLYFVACLICTCFSASVRAPLYGLTGQKISLVPDATGTEQPEEILWKQNGNKVVEFDGRTQTEFGLFQHRVHLDWVSAELNITDLRSDDSGEYDLEVYADKKLRKQTLNLVVLEKVAKPNVICERSKDGEQATLTCSSESRQPQFLTYEWVKHGPGPNLTVTLTDKNEEYTCLVRNLLTNATATFPTKACRPGASVAVIAGISAAVAVVLIAVVVIIYCKKNRKGLNGETGCNEEGTSLIHRTPTVPSEQRLAPGRKSSCEGSNSSIKGDADQLRETDSLSHQAGSLLDVSEEPQAYPSPDQPGNVADLCSKFEQSPDKQAEPQKQVREDGGEKSPPVPLPRLNQQFPAVGTEDTAEHNEGNVADLRSKFEQTPDKQAELQKQVREDGGEKSPPVPLPRLSQQFPAVGTEDTAEHNEGLNSEAPQNKQNNPHSEPPASPGQQPVNLPQDNNNVTFTCNEPDENIKNDQSEKEDGQSQMPARKGNVTDLCSKFEQSPDKQAELQKQVREDGGEKSPPVPLPRLRQQLPTVGTEDTAEHNEGTDSKQVTDKTEEENVEQYPDKNNRAVSDETKSDNDQSLSPPNPEEPDQHAESPDAAHSDLDQENDKTRLDSPECEEQSDNNTTANEGDESEDEGDADENESQCSANVEKSDKESEDEDKAEKDVSK